MNKNIIRQTAIELLNRNFADLSSVLLDSVSVDSSDISLVEKAIGVLIYNLRPVLLEISLSQMNSHSDHYHFCPECGFPLHRWGKRSRTLITSEGVATIPVFRFRCEPCKKDFYPFLDANGLKYDSYTLGAKERISRYACEMPYAHASELSKEFGIEVSPSEVDRISQEVSEWRRKEELMCVERSFPENKETENSPCIPLVHDLDWSEDAVAVLSVDGAMVRSPESGEGGNIWYEVRCGVIGPSWNGKECKGRKAYMGGVYDPDGIFDLLAACHRQSVPKAVRSVFVSDGATWIWERAGLYFPSSTQVLDIYHAGEHVAGAALACWGDGDVRSVLWRKKAREMLLVDDGARSVLRVLIREMREPDLLRNAAGVRREFAYLWRHRHRMKYKSLLAAGMPVGSGGMESAIKQLCSNRLRQPGMMWSKNGAASMLCLRAAHLAGELGGTVERIRRNLLLNAQKYKKCETRGVA